MQLFYSGSTTPDKPQPDPSKSLGGFVSSSPIGNGLLDNIFPAITSAQLQAQESDIRLIVLKNTTSAVVTNVRIWTVRGDYSSYKLAAMAPATDSCSRKVFEQIYNGYALPFQAVLETAEANAPISAGDLAAGGYIGIWIQRTPDNTKFTVLDGLPGAEPTCTQIIATLQAAGTPQYDLGSLVIDWS